MFFSGIIKYLFVPLALTVAFAMLADYAVSMSVTPVILARNLGREGESVTVTELAKLDIDAVDMLTLVMVGSSESRVVAKPDGGVWVYTPRGYAAKMNLEKAS